MYHGMLFGPDGVCRQVPGMDNVPAGAEVPTLAVIERNSWIWVWMGEASQVDPELISFAIGPEDPDWILKTNELQINTSYREEISNLSDLSHVSWVHGETFGGSDDWGYIKPRHELKPRGIETKYCVRRTPAPNFAKHLFLPDARFDINVHVRLSVPCNFILSFAVHEAEEGNPTTGMSKGKILLDTFSSQAVTPRDAGSVDYYFSWGTSRETYFPGIVDLMHQANMQAFLEDKRILEGQRERMLQYPDAPQIDIVHDAGPGRMLFVLDRLLADEAKANGANAQSMAA
jgi:vanillate O-demethylase monooxygenase subunit